MATDSAPVRRNFWQLPTFVVGVAAAISAVAAFPPQPRSPAERLRDQLTELREALERRPADLATIGALTPQAAAAAEQFPDAAPLANFLAGSGQLALAEVAPADADRWAAATAHLGRVEPNQLADAADQKRLVYRKAKALAAVGAGDPAELLPVLLNLPPGEDPDGERRRLLADVALRMTPPDLTRARDELTSYLTGPARAPVPALARYRLKLGEVHLALKEPDKARAWLKEIDDTAPADVQAQAMAQLARLAAAENNWAEAVKLFEAAQAAPGMPADQRGAIRYQAGVAYARLNNPTAAVPHFEAAARETGPVALAAAVRVAELLLRDPALRGQRARAVDQLEAAVRQAGSQFQNPYLTVEEVRAAFEEAVTVCVREAEFGSAVRAASAYTPVATGGRDRERRAEVHLAWAQALQRAPTAGDQPANHFRAAAEDYSQMAATYPTASGKADLLRKAAACLRQAGDTVGAGAIIDQLTTMPGLTEDVVAAAWLEKGEALLAGNQFAEATQALQKATAGPSGMIARVKLAVAHLDQAKRKGATDEARGMTALAQQLLTQVANTTATTSPEREAQHQALFELGKLLLAQGNIPDGEARFRQLTQADPTGPKAGTAKLYLGSCLLLLARGAHQGGRPPADADRKLTEALGYFSELAKADDPFLKTQADIRLANATLLLKRYDEMPDLCEKLIERYRGKVEELIVLSMLYSSYRFADLPGASARTLSRMEEVFAKLGPDAFPGGSEEYTRDYWVKSWFEPLRRK
jgi:tetratricopeptide (TPR) repeat protein